jgi:hypothetical protein
VIARVGEIDNVDDATRALWVDELAAFVPVRRHGVRNTVIFWLGVMGAAMLAQVVGLPGWLGFVMALGVFVWLARALAVRALEWRLAQLQAGLKPG